MPTIVQIVAAGADAASTTKAVALTQPAADNLCLVFGAAVQSSSGSLPILLSPSGLTERAANRSGGNNGMVFGDKVATGSGETSFSIDNTNSDALCVCGINLSGAGSLTTKGTANSVGTSQDGLTVTAEGAVATDGSLGVVYFVRRGKLNGGDTSMTVSSGWASVATAHDGSSPADEAELKVYSKTLNVSDGTVSVVFSDTPTDSQHSAILVIYPPDATPPVFDSNTADQICAVGVERAINQSVTYTDGSTVTADLSCGETKGDLGVTLSGSATVSVGSNNSHSFTISGTIADVDATLGTLTYTAIAVGADTVTVSLDDGVNSAVPDTIGITNYTHTVVATTQTLLNTALATMTYINSSPASETLSGTVTDSGGRTGANSADVVTSSSSLGQAFYIRRRQDSTWV